MCYFMIVVTRQHYNGMGVLILRVHISPPRLKYWMRQFVLKSLYVLSSWFETPFINRHFFSIWTSHTCLTPNLSTYAKWKPRLDILIIIYNRWTQSMNTKQNCTAERCRRGFTIFSTVIFFIYFDYFSNAKNIVVTCKIILLLYQLRNVVL